MLAVAALAFPCAVLADADASAATTIEPETIVIEAAPFRLSADDLVQATDVVAGEELERRRHGTIGDVLDGRPGISNASFGPGVGRPVIRGQGGPRVQVLENGISSMDASAISPDHAVSLDPLGAEQIEVIKGPATLIYGGSASAGVVNVVDDRLPLKIAPGLRAIGGFSYGDNADETNAAVKLRHGGGGFQLGAQYAHRDAGDFSIPGYATRAGLEHDHDHDHGHEHAEEEPEPYGVLRNSSLTTESYGASAAWIGGRGMLGAAVTRFDTNYGIAGHTHAEEEGSEPAPPIYDGVRIDMQQTRTDLRGVLYEPFAGFERAEWRAGINDYRHRELTPQGEVGTTFNVQEVESRIELAHRPLASWAGVVGLQFQHRDFEAVGIEAFVPPVITRDVGLFVVEGQTFGGGHRVEIGARVDSVSHRPEPSGIPDRDFTPFSVSAGTNLLLGEHMHLRFNAQSTQRAPASEELYAYGPHVATSAFERGSLALDPETTNGVDIGLARDKGVWIWELSAFYNKTRDYIFLREVDAGLNADGSGTAEVDGVADRVDESGQFDADGELLLLDFHQRDADFYGGEVSARYRLLDASAYRLDVHGFADIARGQLVSGHENLPRMTPVRFGIGVDGRYGAWSAGIDYMRAMEQDRTAPLETNTPGYDLLSADLAYTFAFGRTETSLYLRGRNLLDETQRLSTSFLKDISPQPGRSLFVGMRVEFGAPK